MSEILNADHEYRAHADQHASLRLWLRLLSCTTRVEDKIPRIQSACRSACFFEIVAAIVVLHHARGRQDSSKAA